MFSPKGAVEIENKVSVLFQELADHGCVEKLSTVLLDIEARPSVLSEVTAAIAVMADDGIQ